MKRIILLTLLLLWSWGFSQSPLSRRTISGIQFQTIHKGNWQIANQATFPTFLKIYDTQSGNMIPLPETFVRTEVMFQSEILYGISNSLNLFARIPFRWRNYYSPDLTQKNKGFGDLALGGYFQFAGNWNGEVLFIAPTGEANNLKTSELPLGDGVFQAGAMINGALNVGKVPLVVSAFYLYRGANKQKTDLGDRLGVQLSAYQHYSTSYGNFATELGLRYQFQMQDRADNSSTASDEFHHLVFFPGIQYYYNTQFRSGIQIPVTIYHRQSWFTEYAIMLNADIFFKTLK